MDQQVFSIIPPDHQLPASTSVPPMKRLHWLRWLVILVLLLLIGWVLLHHSKKQTNATARTPSAGPIAVTPATAMAGNIAVYLNAIGTVTPVYTDSITSQVTGVITAVHYSEGQVVQKGDPLIDIDPQPYAAQLAEAKGTFKHDENVLAEAQMDLDRYRQSWAGNGISRQQLEDQEKVVLQEQGTVDYDRGAVQYAQVQLNYCHILAPISGRVGLRLVDPGNLVTANATTSLAVITQLRPITVVFTLAEDDVSQVLEQMRQRQQLTVQAYDRSKQNLLSTGKLLTVDNQVDTTTGTVKARAAFENAKGELFPNEFVNTRLLVTTLRGQILVPTSAIQHNGEMAFVYVLQNNKAVMRTVKPGASDSGKTAIQGLEAGDVVANSSFDKLQNGSSISLSQFTLPAGSSEANESVAP